MNGACAFRTRAVAQVTRCQATVTYWTFPRKIARAV